MSRYRVAAVRPVLEHEPGSEFVVEVSLPADIESDLLSSGRLELLPSAYRNVGSQVVLGAKPGELLHAAIPAFQVSALIQGGHLEPEAQEKPPAKAGKEK